MSEKNLQKPLTIHGKMAKIKQELSETKIEKSGHNKYAGFKYHELSDFISVINKLNLKHGVNDFVEIKEQMGYCRITLVNVDDSDDKYSIVTPFREAQMLAKGGAPSNVDVIQRMGSTITYNRRYLYMTAYNIQENDGVDVQEPVEKKPQPKKALPKLDYNKAVKAIEERKTTVADIIKVRTVTDAEKKALQEVEQVVKSKK
jgi:hypothetical protein